MDQRNSLDSFLSSLATNSAAKYKVRIEQFELYCKMNDLEIVPQTVQLFIVELHEKYMASTLWTIFSMLKSYFLHLFQLNLTLILPGVSRLLKQWEKSEAKTQSKVTLLLVLKLIFCRYFRKRNWIDSFGIVPIHQNGFISK